MIIQNEDRYEQSAVQGSELTISMDKLSKFGNADWDNFDQDSDNIKTKEKRPWQSCSIRKR